MKTIADIHHYSKKMQVLYVEDDVHIFDEMTRYLKKIFLEVVTASNGFLGLEAYKSGKFELVITDLSMPVMNGIDMLQEIKKIDESQNVLITSAHTESEYMFAAIKLGVDGYIIKPFEFNQLNQELYKIVEKIQKFHENEDYKRHLSQMVEQRTLELNNAMMFQSQNYNQTLQAMVDMIEERDTYTAGHSKRVAKYSRLIAEKMGYSVEDCTKLYQAGILHDVGKVATPDAVLLNPKSLNKIEYQLIQEHVTVSYRLLSSIPMFQELAEIVYSHHERYDGYGYPKGQKEDEIHQLSRIMIVADAFDAMTTNRIYKARKTVAMALVEIKSLQLQQFHPEVVAAALEVLKEIKIDETISQLPKTQLEKERFAYFYKDILCDVYNQSYLDLVLAKHTAGEDVYKYLYLLEFKKFGAYNKMYGWNKGDIFLKSIAHFLVEEFQNAIVFRIFGDDFVILSKMHLNTKKIAKKIEQKLEKGIDYSLRDIDIENTNIDYIEQVLYH